MDSWYKILGDEGIRTLVDAFYNCVFFNSKIAHLFKNPIEEIKDKQYCFLSQFLGGPQRYTEKYGVPKMRFRHLPHPIDPSAMEEWLRCMRSAIEKLPLDDRQKEDLYACFPTLARHMVNS